MSITCDCVPTPREFSYGNSTPEIPVGDLRIKIEDREYYQDRTIDSFYLPVCKTIGVEAFRGSSLVEIDAPECTEVKTGAFQDCWVSDVSLPSCKKIGASSFRVIQDSSHIALNSLELPNVEEIGEYAFYEIRIQHPVDPCITFEKVKKIGAYAFREASAVYLNGTNIDMNMPYCTDIGEGAFSAFYSGYETKWRTLKLPSIVNLDGVGNKVYISNWIKIGPSCAVIKNFNANASAVYMYKTTPPTLSGGISNITTIYVPEGSKQTYISSSSWSSLSNKIQEFDPTEEPL